MNGFGSQVEQFQKVIQDTAASLTGGLFCDSKGSNALQRSFLRAQAEILKGYLEMVEGQIAKAEASPEKVEKIKVD